MRKKYLVLCDDLIQAGGLLRFVRFGREIRELGHSLSFAYFSHNPSFSLDTSFEVMPFDEAKTQDWDVTMVPGAGFPMSTIERFSQAVSENFGLRIQHILSAPYDEEFRKRFLIVNRAFKPDHVIFNNHQWEIGSFTDFQAKKFSFLVGGVDMALFQLGADRIFPDGQSNITIGGLLNKNANILIESLRYLPENYRLNLLGNSDGLDLEMFEQEIRSRIDLSGWLDDSELSEYYKNVDCIVHPVRTAGWANICAEGMASGVPIVCTRFGTGAFAKDNETAILLSDDPKPEEIAGKLIDLFSEKGLAERIVKEGRKKIESYSWEKYSLELDQLCKKIENFKFRA